MLQTLLICFGARVEKMALIIPMIGSHRPACKLMLIPFSCSVPDSSFSSIKSSCIEWNISFVFKLPFHSESLLNRSLPILWLSVLIYSTQVLFSRLSACLHSI